MPFSATHIYNTIFLVINFTSDRQMYFIVIYIFETYLSSTAHQRAGKSDVGTMDISASPVIVIGAGPVGLYAAFQVGLTGHRPIIVDALPFTGGQCAALYPDGVIFDAPAHREIAAGALVADLKAQLLAFDPLYLTSRRVKSVWGSLDSGFNVETDTGETITGAAVIYAGGAGALQPRPLTVEGADAAPGDVSYVAEDARETDGKRVAVIGDSQAAIDLALDASHRATSVSLIHSAPLRAEGRRVEDLTKAAAARRLTLVQGDLSKVKAANGRLASIEVSVNGRTEAHEVDLLLVKAGLEYVSETITGLTPIADPATGETQTPGIFIVGDAVPSASRPPVIAAGFSEALRAAQAASLRIDPNRPATLPHTAISPALQARLNVA